MYLTGLHGHGTSAWPGRQRRPHRMHRLDERPALLDQPQRRGAHPGHDPHRHHHVRRVGDLHPELGDGAAQRAHAERHHVHRPAPHAPVEDLRERRPHLLRRDPVVGRPRVIFLLRADERAVFHAGHIDGSDRHQKLFGRSAGFSRVKVPPSTSRVVSRSHSSCDPSHHTTASGLVSFAISRTQAVSSGRLVFSWLSGKSALNMVVSPGGTRHLGYLRHLNWLWGG